MARPTRSDPRHFPARRGGRLPGRLSRRLAGRLAGIVALAAMLGGAVAGRVAAEPDAGWSGRYLGASLGVATEAEDELLQSLHLGLAGQGGRLTYGAELEVTRTDIGTDAGPIGRILRLKARTGLLHDGLNLYATTGLGHADGAFGDALGFVLGVGIETRMGPDLLLGAELLHQGFPEVDGAADGLGVNTLSGRLTFLF